MLNFIKRTCFYLYRKKGKTAILFLLILTISTFVLACFSILYAAQDVAKQMRTSVGAAFHLRPGTGISVGDGGNVQASSDDGPVITDASINQILALQEVRLHNARNPGYAKSEQLSFIPGVGHNADNNMGEVSANTHSALHPDFRDKNLELVAGRHITAQDECAVLISEEAAALSGLAVGDEIVLSPAGIGMENGIFYNTLASSTVSATAQVVGIYRTLVPQPDAAGQPTAGLAANKLFSDHTLLNKLGLASAGRYTGGVSFFIGDPAAIDEIVTEARQMKSIDWGAFFLRKEDFAYGKIADGLAMIQKMVGILLTCVSIVSIAVLVLILAMRIRGRVHEAGILLSIGLPKRQIILQFIAEAMAVAIIAFALSFLLAGVISNAVQVRLFGDMQIEQLAKSLLSTEITPAASTAKALYTPAATTALLYLCQTAVIVLSVLASSMAIVKLKPRDILAKMS